MPASTAQLKRVKPGLGRTLSANSNQYRKKSQFTKECRVACEQPGIGKTVTSDAEFRPPEGSNGQKVKWKLTWP
jgi:hypothetical protein